MDATLYYNIYTHAARTIVGVNNDNNNKLYMHRVLYRASLSKCLLPPSTLYIVFYILSIDLQVGAALRSVEVIAAGGLVFAVLLVVGQRVVLGFVIVV